MPNIVTTSLPTVLPDGLLIQRIAALGDRTALAELDARHGMTLYAVAYTLTFDPNAADLAVSATFREVWRSAASFIAGQASVQRWLADLTRRAVRAGVSRPPTMRPGGLPQQRSIAVAPRPLPAAHVAPRRRRLAAVTRFLRMAATLVLPTIPLA